MKAKNKGTLAALLSAAMCIGLLAGCGGDADDGKNVAAETWVSTGVAYLTEDGELNLLKDLGGEGEAIRLSNNGGTFATGEHYFTNAPTDGETIPAAMFSKDGKLLYYFTDIDGGFGVLRCADVRRLKAGSDQNKNYLEKLTSDVYGKLLMQNNGVVYAAQKNDNQKIYFHNGEAITECVPETAEKGWFTNDGKGIVCWTADGTLEYIEFGKDPEVTELIPAVDRAWYDGGEVIYYRPYIEGESAGGAAASGDSGSDFERDYDYDREATDESSSGYDNYEDTIYCVTLDGKSEAVLDELYSVVAVADGKLYYTLRYEDHIRLSNLVENVERLDPDTLYELDHTYIDDRRYELWCYDGKDKVMLCEDYYNYNRYGDGDYYEDPEDYLEEMLSKTDYILSVDFLKQYWDKLEDIDDLCEDYDIDSIDALAERLYEAAHGEYADYAILDEYAEIIDDSDIYDILEDSYLEPCFYADGQIVIYTRAIKDEVAPIAATSADMAEKNYWVQRCGGNPFTLHASYILVTGESGTIEGVDANDFCGVLGDGTTLVFYDAREGVLSAYTVPANECVLTVENASYATIAGDVVYYYEDDSLVCYDGEETTVLAEGVYAGNCAAWVYPDGLTLALSDVSDGEGTLRAYEDGEGDWIADDVSYYQRITDKEIIYISDGTLYIYTIGKEAVQLADDVVAAYGAYYGGTLIGYAPAN